MTTAQASNDASPDCLPIPIAPDQRLVWWHRQGAKIIAALAVAAIWYFKILPEDSSPETLMVKPAAATLESGVQPAKNLSDLSDDLGFDVEIPHLEQLGAQLSSVGKAHFGGQNAAVMEFKYGQSTLLLYSFNDTTKLFDEMTLVDPGTIPLYLTSGGAVSVVAWRDNHACYHALAAKSSEENMLNLARMVVTYL